MEQKKKFKTIFITLLAAVAMVGFGYGMAKALKPEASEKFLKPVEALNASTAAVSGTPMVPANFSDLAEKVRPGVVNIQVVRKVKNVGFGAPHFNGNPFGGRNPFEDFFGPSPEGNSPRGFEQRGVGSGFVMSEDGFILTNNHVIEDADRIKVKFADGKDFTARVVGRDPKTDLALVKIEGASALHPLKLGCGNREPVRAGADRDRGHCQRQGQGDRVRAV